MTPVCGISSGVLGTLLVSKTFSVRLVFCNSMEELIPQVAVNFSHQVIKLLIWAPSWVEVFVELGERLWCPAPGMQADEGILEREGAQEARR